MKDVNALRLLTEVMGWKNSEEIGNYVSNLQLMAEYKYDHYKRYNPGKRFIENLALWLNQFEPGDRAVALEIVMKYLIFISENEFTHLVRIAYQDIIVQERIRLVAEEQAIPCHMVGKITQQERFIELRKKSLYLGLSDGARTNELRRVSNQEINNEQIWQAYELSNEKAEDMLKELNSVLENKGKPKKFNLIWLLDDFSGSGNTYIKYDNVLCKYKGKIPKVYERLHSGGLVDPSHYEVFLLLYIATRQAIDHIEYWAERFTSENGYKPMKVRVMCPIEYDLSFNNKCEKEIVELIEKRKYYDEKVEDKHLKEGGTTDARFGFAKCALPVVLSHNTPNNSIYLLWGPEHYSFFGLFPRVSRHREF